MIGAVGGTLDRLGGRLHPSLQERGAIRHVTTCRYAMDDGATPPPTGESPQLMATLVPLRHLLIEAFEELQTLDLRSNVEDFTAGVQRLLPSRDSGAIHVVKTSSVTSKGWLLFSLTEALGTTPKRSCLLISTNANVHKLGHALLASTFSPGSFRSGYLEDEDWHRVSGLIQRIRNADLSLMGRGRDSTLTFSWRVEQQVLEMKPDWLVIDQPKRCFPIQNPAIQACSLGIPDTIRALAERMPLQIYILETDQPEPGTARIRTNRTKRNLAHRWNRKSRRPTQETP